MGFYEVGQLLVTNVAQSLVDSVGGPVQRACVVPGDIVWDDCNCGLLAVTVLRWFLSDDFPESSSGFAASSNTRTTPCDLPWLVGELHVQVVRCAPTPGDNAVSVPCVELDAAAQILWSDAYVTITETVSTLCGLREADQIIDYVLGGQETRGPLGDCVGSDLTVQVGLMR